MSVSKKVILAGHCGPDAGYLRMVVKKTSPDVEVLMADDSQELTQLLARNDINLILFNRELGYGFDPDQGAEVIRMLRPTLPNAKMMLISNYPDAQQAAVAAGALPGFGKRELGSPRVLQLLREALGVEQKVQPGTP
jgi:two-component system chemotaxis response regulator CheY